MATPKPSSHRDVKPLLLSLFVAVCLTLAVLSLVTNLADQGVFGTAEQSATPTATFIPITLNGEVHQGQGQHRTATAVVQSTVEAPTVEATATPRPTLALHTPHPTLPDPED